MGLPNYRVRRATLEDIGQLTSLWQSMGFPVEDLARRITEFQVAEGESGTVLGAIAITIAERQGRIHSEGFSDFALAEHLRPLLWDRLHVVANNYGLTRLWTQEQAPFWNHCGMAKADAAVLEKLPAAWRESALSWLTLKLKEDVEEVISLDREFSVFMQAEKERTNRTLQRARMLKTFATLIAVVLFLVVIVGAYIIVRKNPQLLHPQ